MWRDGHHRGNSHAVNKILNWIWGANHLSLKTPLSGKAFLFYFSAIFEISWVSCADIPRTYSRENGFEKSSDPLYVHSHDQRWSPGSIERCPTVMQGFSFCSKML